MSTKKIPRNKPGDTVGFGKQLNQFELKTTNAVNKYKKSFKISPAHAVYLKDTNASQIAARCLFFFDPTVMGTRIHWLISKLQQVFDSCGAYIKKK